MSRFQIKGWCPGALRPMLSGDGLVVRIKPHMARLTAAQAQGVAAAALRHGNGLIDLSNRANIQLRGIRPAAHLALLDDLDALGLIDPDVAQERHRNITVSPFWTDTDGTEQMADALTSLLSNPENAALPGKFGVAIDLGVALVLQSTPADIRIERLAQGLLVRPDGFTTGALVQTMPQAIAAAGDLIAWFLAQTGGRGRMRSLSGQPLPPGHDWPMQAMAPVPKPGPHSLGQLVALEFGQMRAETLAALARGPLRLTPWRMILMESRDAPDLPGLIHDPQDPRLNVTACTGAPGCPQGLQPTRDLARRLAPLVPPGQHLHVSGCAKGCAHPGPADLTLCATQIGFDLIRQGRASDTPAHAFDPSFPFKAP